MSYYLGIDLGGTSIKAGVVDHQGRVVAKSSAATHGKDGPDAVLKDIAKLAATIVEQAKLKMDQIQAVGIGSPGPIDFENGRLASAPNLPAFRDVPIRDRIAAATGRPAFLENDANAAALAEYWIGAGQDPKIRHLVALTLGTGIGGGVVVDGKIVHGGFGNAGEAGHLIVMPNGRLCGCGQRGCIEAYASATHTAKRAAEAIEAGETSTLTDVTTKQNRALTAKDVFDAAKANDALALRIVDETALYLGITCVSLCRLLDPQIIVLAGGMVEAGDFLIDKVRQAFTSQNWQMAKPRVRIVPPQLGSDAGLIGAAAVAWNAQASSTTASQASP